MKRLLSGINTTDFRFVVAITFVGLVIRLPALRFGYWRDEGSTYYDVLPTALGDVLHRVTFTELSPPAFFLMMHAWLHTMGADGVVLKLPALIMGTLLIPAVFVLANALGSRAAAYVAAIVTTLAPEAILFSQEARPQIMAALVAVLTVIAYLRFVEERNRRAWMPIVAFAAAGTLLVYTQYTGLAVLACLACYSIYLVISRQSKLWPHALAFLLIVFAFAPWFQTMLDQRSVGLPGAGKVLLTQIPTSFIENASILMPVSWPLTGWPHRLLLLVVILLEVCFLGLLLRATHKRSNLQLLLVATIANVIALIEAFLWPTVPRYLFVAAPFAWVGVSYGAMAMFGWLARRPTMQRRPVTACIVLVFAALAAVDTRYALTLGEQPKSGVPALLAYLNERHTVPAFYVIAPDYIASGVGYYTRHSPSPLYGFTRWSTPEVSTLRGQAQLWAEPDIVQESISKVLVLTRHENLPFALIAQEKMTRHGEVATNKTNDFVAGLVNHYRVVDYHQFPGVYESVALYLLR